MKIASTLFLVLIASTLFLVLIGGTLDAFKPTEQRVAEEKTDTKSTPHVKGNFPALTSAGSSRLNEIPTEYFNKDKVPCTTKQELALALWERSKKGQNPDGSPTLFDWGVDDVQLADGKGKIVGLVYFFLPGDPGVVTTMTEFYLVNTKCNFRFLKFGTMESGRP